MIFAVLGAVAELEAASSESVLALAFGSSGEREAAWTTSVAVHATKVRELRQAGQSYEQIGKALGVSGASAWRSAQSTA